MPPILAACIQGKLGIVISTALYPNKKPHNVDVYYILIFTFVGLSCVVATTFRTYSAQFCAVLPTA